MGLEALCLKFSKRSLVVATSLILRFVLNIYPLLLDIMYREFTNQIDHAEAWICAYTNFLLCIFICMLAIRE